MTRVHRAIVWTLIAACASPAPHAAQPIRNAIDAPSGYAAALELLRAARSHLQLIAAPPPSTEPGRLVWPDVDPLAHAIADGVALIEPLTRPPIPVLPIDPNGTPATHRRAARALVARAMDRIRDDVPGPSTGATSTKIAVIDRLAAIASADESGPRDHHPDYDATAFYIATASRKLDEATAAGESVDARVRRELAAATQECARHYSGTFSSHDYIENTYYIDGEPPPTEQEQAAFQLDSALGRLAEPETDVAGLRARDEARAHIQRALTMIARRAR